jgi:hypothetical protein
MTNFSYSPEHFDDEANSQNPYNEIQNRVQRREISKEKIKESHRPKKEIEEHDNVTISKALKTKIDVIEEELAKRNKENKAIAYALGIATDTIEKMQKEMSDLVEVVKEIKEDSSVYMDEDEDEKLLAKDYDSKIDIDTITNNILYKLKEEIPSFEKKAKKTRFDLSKKDWFVLLAVVFLLFTNSFVQNTIEGVLSFGSKESLSTQYKVSTGDFAVCTTKNSSSESKFALKIDSILNVEKTNDGKIWFIIGEYTCYKDSLNKN